VIPGSTPHWERSVVSCPRWWVWWLKKCVVRTQSGALRSWGLTRVRYTIVAPSFSGVSPATKASISSSVRVRCVSQLVEVGVELLAKGLDLKGLAEEASEPDPVSQKKVVQRPMDRAKESVSVLFALGIRETRAERVEFSVHPPVVARQQPTVFGGCQ